MTLLITRATINTILAQHRAELMDDLLDHIEQGYLEMANGTASEHPRVYLRSKTDPQRRPPGLFSMSALLESAGRMGTRLISLGGVDDTNGDGLLILFDQLEKKCLAIIWDPGFHNYRTGAPAGIATKRLANPAARTIGVIGSSGIAEGTLSILHHVLPDVRTVRVYSSSPANRERFAERMTRLLDCKVVAVDDAAAAVRDAEIIITATSADRPVLPDDGVRAGAFVAAMARNEVERKTLLRGRNILSSYEGWSALDPPLNEPFPEDTIVGDLAGVVAGTVPICFDPEAVTVVSLGAPVSMWDVAAASAAHELCLRRGLGKEISLYE